MISAGELTDLGFCLMGGHALSEQRLNTHEVAIDDDGTPIKFTCCAACAAVYEAMAPATTRRLGEPLA
jgi:hypothetical protein